MGLFQLDDFKSIEENVKLTKHPLQTWLFRVPKRGFVLIFYLQVRAPVQLRLESHVANEQMSNEENPGRFGWS